MINRIGGINSSSVTFSGHQRQQGTTISPVANNEKTVMDTSKAHTGNFSKLAIGIGAVIGCVAFPVLAVGLIGFGLFKLLKLPFKLLGKGKDALGQAPGVFHKLVEKVKGATDAMKTTA